MTEEQHIAINNKGKIYQMAVLARKHTCSSDQEIKMMFLLFKQVKIYIRLIND